MVEFRILGPLEITINGVRLPLGSSREQRVLAALLLDADRVVPLARLMEAVWDGPPPPTAAKALRNCVSTLRQRLAAAGVPGEPIVTEPAGYRLDVRRTGQVDLHEFVDQVARARRSASAGQLDDAVERLRQALGLWRGDALGGVTGRLVEAAAARLDEQRRTVLEECLAHELSLGRDHQLVAELSALVEWQPLRERARGLLMLALHRSGRRDQALETYRQGRRVLVAELGIEPGQELAELHRAILADDDRLRVAGGPDHRHSSAARYPTPAQLPADTRWFSGRTAELAELDALLESGLRTPAVVISAVSGTAGVGKTTLAVHWAHRVADRFPDGHLYANLRGFDPTGAVAAPAEVVRGFLDALGVPPQRLPASLDAQVSLYRSLLAGRRALVLLDNARDADQVRPLLPGTAGCLVVVTSRDRLSGLVVADGAQPFALSLPSTDEARRLLADRIHDGRVAAEAGAVDRIIARCARLPLALAIVAARAVTHPRLSLSVLADQLDAAHGSLDAFAGGDAATDVRAVLSWSYRALDPATARLIRLLGVHPGPDIDAVAAAALAGLPRSGVEPLLSKLTRAHLLDEHVPDRYRFHDLLRSYAAERSELEDTEGGRLDAMRRALDHYLHASLAAARRLDPHRQVITPPTPPPVPAREIAGYDQAMAWFTTEHATLLAATGHAARNGLDTYAWQLPWTLATFHFRQGRWHSALVAQQTAVAAARRTGDRAAMATAHRQLGRAYALLGRHADASAEHRRALGLWRELGDHAGQARAHLALGWVREQQRRHAEALWHDQRALELFRADGNLAWQARALSSVGWCHVLLGNHHQALAQCQQALDLFRRLGDREGEAVTLDSAGYAHHQLGQHAEAISHYRQAIDLCRELGDEYHEADTLHHLGDTYHASGAGAAARRSWQQALTLLDRLDHPDAGQVRAKLHG